MLAIIVGNAWGIRARVSRPFTNTVARLSVSDDSTLSMVATVVFFVTGCPVASARVLGAPVAGPVAVADALTAAIAMSVAMAVGVAFGATVTMISTVTCAAFVVACIVAGVSKRAPARPTIAVVLIAVVAVAIVGTAVPVAPIAAVARAYVGVHTKEGGESQNRVTASSGSHSLRP